MRSREHQQLLRGGGYQLFLQSRQSTETTIGLLAKDSERRNVHNFVLKHSKNTNLRSGKLCSNRREFRTALEGSVPGTGRELPISSFPVPLVLQPSILVGGIYGFILPLSVLHSFLVFSGHCSVNSRQPQFHTDTSLRVTDSKGVLLPGLHPEREKRPLTVFVVLTPPSLQVCRGSITSPVLKPSPLGEAFGSSCPAA